MTGMHIKKLTFPSDFHISVMSRKMAMDRFGIGHDAPIPGGVAIVSISSPEPFCGSLTPIEFDEDSLVGLLKVQFADVLPDEEGAMTEEQGWEVLSFARRLADEGRCHHLVVHCDGGVSRSAGVAAALGLLSGIGDQFVFDSPRFCPNMGCYRKVLAAGFADVSDEEADAKERHNLDVWKRARPEDFDID